MEKAKRYSRVFFVSFWLFLLFLIASNIQAGWLYVVIVFFVLLVVMSMVYPSRMMKGLRIEMALPVYTERGASSNATLKLVNPTRKKRYMVRVDSDAKSDFSFVSGGALFVTVEKNSEVSLPIEYSCSRRGRVCPERLVATCGAPAGIFYARRLISCDSYTIVYPSLKKIDEREQSREFSLYDPGPLQKLVASQDPYHYSLREYNPGDSLRNMHWKLTARRGEPIVRVHERKIFGQASIVVDNMRESYAAGRESLFEDALEKAIAAAHNLLFNERYNVTVAGTAAPAITLENEAAWERALHWFAMIQLETARPEPAYGEEQAFSSDLELFFGAGGGK